MKRFYWVFFSLGILGTLSLMAARLTTVPDAITVFGAIILILVAAIPTLLFARIKQDISKTEYWKGTFLIFSILSILWVTPKFLDGVEIWWFQKNLYQYTKIIDEFKSGKILISSEIQTIDLSKFKNLPSRVALVRAASCGNNNIIVEFFNSSARINNGYMFNDCNDLDNGEIKNHIEKHKIHTFFIADKWYEFSYN